jgi:hypothetical protein
MVLSQPQPSEESLNPALQVSSPDGETFGEWVQRMYTLGLHPLNGETLGGWLQRIDAFDESLSEEVTLSPQEVSPCSNTLNLYPIDLETFQAWLQEGAQTGGIAGKTCQATGCPLARFLVDLYGGSWVVNSNEYELLPFDFSEIDEKHSLPSWVKRFVLNIDASTDAEGEPVSYTDALFVLSQVLKEEVSHA